MIFGLLLRVVDSLNEIGLETVVVDSVDGFLPGVRIVNAIHPS